jgi:hypothetical protein
MESEPSPGARHRAAIFLDRGGSPVRGAPGSLALRTPTRGRLFAHRAGKFAEGSACVECAGARREVTPGPRRRGGPRPQGRWLDPPPDRPPRRFPACLPSVPPVGAPVARSAWWRLAVLAVSRAWWAHEGLAPAKTGGSSKRHAASSVGSRACAMGGGSGSRPRWVRMATTAPRSLISATTWRRPPQGQARTSSK